MFYATKIESTRARTPSHYLEHSRGYRQQILIDRHTGSPHMSLSIGHLDEGGHVDSVLHSFEISLYVFSGTLAVTTLGTTTLLPPNHCIVLPLGATYSMKSVEGAVEFLQMASPAELTDGRRHDTAGGSDVNAPTVSPSMATALLAYSGIGVKMLVDQQLGAHLHTMFVVDYQPTAIAHPHDHPFEEAYVFVEGEVHALVEGNLMVLHAGDVLWTGVGADHGFENRSAGLVRWIEVQAPQPPSRHSYRFSREWEHLESKIGQDD
jgi:mannose-6-phosphate isomerase-like protein (cupin superfamily)